MWPLKNPRHAGISGSGWDRLCSVLEADSFLQLIKAGFGFVQLLVQLLAVSQAFQLKLGQFDVVDGALGSLSRLSYRA